MHRALALCMAVGLVIPMHGSASSLAVAKPPPHTYTVNVGVQLTGDPTLIGKINVAVNKFFPDKLTIHVGDSIRFININPNLPQTVTFGPIENTPALLPSATKPEVNPRIVMSRGGTKVVNPASTVYSSGVLVSGIGGARTQYTFTFPTAGTYLYRSLFHPDSQGTIVVVPPGAPASAEPLDQGPSLYGSLRSLVELVPTMQQASSNALGGNVQIGIGNGDISIQGFFSPVAVLHVGQSVTWTIDETSGDPHALVFGETTNDELQGTLPLYTGLADDGGLRVNSSYWKPSLISGSTVITSTAFAGTKRWTSGILYKGSVTSPSAVPSQYSLTFNVVGNFQYVDPFHRGMVGSVDVLP